MGLRDAHFIAGECARVARGNKLESSLRRAAALTISAANMWRAHTRLKGDKLLAHLRRYDCIRARLCHLRLLRARRRVSRCAARVTSSERASFARSPPVVPITNGTAWRA